MQNGAGCCTTIKGLKLYAVKTKRILAESEFQNKALKNSLFLRLKIDFLLTGPNFSVPVG